VRPSLATLVRVGDEPFFFQVMFSLMPHCDDLGLGPSLKQDYD
jgi:hypothetical protein